MTTANLKQEAYRPVEDLPENATWEDCMHRIYVRETNEAGLASSRAGRIVEVSDTWLSR